jgi:hypothetical protein
MRAELWRSLLFGGLTLGALFRLLVGAFGFGERRPAKGAEVNYPLSSSEAAKAQRASPAVPDSFSKRPSLDRYLPPGCRTGWRRYITA